MTDHDERWEQALARLSPEELEFGHHKAAALLEVTELLDAKRGRELGSAAFSLKLH
jgi:hypothetical protein